MKNLKTVHPRGLVLLRGQRHLLVVSAVVEQVRHRKLKRIISKMRPGIKKWLNILPRPGIHRPELRQFSKSRTKLDQSVSRSLEQATEEFHNMDEQLTRAERYIIESRGRAASADENRRGHFLEPLSRSSDPDTLGGVLDEACLTSNVMPREVSFQMVQLNTLGRQLIAISLVLYFQPSKTKLVQVHLYYHLNSILNKLINLIDQKRHLDMLNTLKILKLQLKWQKNRILI